MKQRHGEEHLPRSGDGAGPPAGPLRERGEGGRAVPPSRLLVLSTGEGWQKFHLNKSLAGRVQAQLQVGDGHSS